MSRRAGGGGRPSATRGEPRGAGRYEPEGKLAQHLKDVDLMREVGHAIGAPLMATALHRQLLLAGVAAGWSERDNSSIMAGRRGPARPVDERATVATLDEARYERSWVRTP